MNREQTMTELLKQLPNLLKMMIANANMSATVNKIKRTLHFRCSEFERFVALLSTPFKLINSYRVRLLLFDIMVWLTYIQIFIVQYIFCK